MSNMYNMAWCTSKQLELPWNGINNDHKWHCGSLQKYVYTTIIYKNLTALDLQYIQARSESNKVVLLHGRK